MHKFRGMTQSCENGVTDRWTGGQTNRTEFREPRTESKVQKAAEKQIKNNHPHTIPVVMFLCHLTYISLLYACYTTY